MLHPRMIARTLAVALLLGLAAPVLAAPPAPPEPPDHGRMRHAMGPQEMGPLMGSPAVHRLMMAMHSLDLSDDQKGQIHAKMEEFHTANEAKLVQLGAAQKALADRELADPIDEAGIRSDVATMAGLRADVAVAEAYLVKDLRGVLTDDQRDQLDKEIAKTPDDIAIPRHHGG